MIICGRPDRPGTAWRLSEKVLQIRPVQQPGQDHFFYSPGCDRARCHRPLPRHHRRARSAAVRRTGRPPLLLRRNIVIDAETAQLVVAAVQAAL